MTAVPENSVHPEYRAAWRRWLETHHASSPEVWIITRRKASGGVPCHTTSVKEALCFATLVQRGERAHRPRPRPDGGEATGEAHQAR